MNRLAGPVPQPLFGSFDTAAYSERADQLGSKKHNHQEYQSQSYEKEKASSIGADLFHGQSEPVLDPDPDIQQQSNRSERHNDEREEPHNETLDITKCVTVQHTPSA